MLGSLAAGASALAGGPDPSTHLVVFAGMALTLAGVLVGGPFGGRPGPQEQGERDAVR